MKGTQVIAKDAIPNWTISGFVEFIKAGQKQGDMVLIVPEGSSAVRLGNEASIKQKLKLENGTFYAVTFIAGRTCAQEEKINVSVIPTIEKNDWGFFPIQTVYSSNGWDSYAYGFPADYSEVELVIHNPGLVEDPACGPIVDSVAIKTLNPPIRTNGKFSHQKLNLIFLTSALKQFRAYLDLHYTLTSMSTEFCQLKLE